MSPWNGRHRIEAGSPSDKQQQQPQWGRVEGGGGDVAHKQLVTVTQSNRTHYIEHIKAIGERTKELESNCQSLHVALYLVDGVHAWAHNLIFEFIHSLHVN